MASEQRGAEPAGEALQPAAGAAEGSPYRRHVPALDGVRGIAVLGVMASHLFYANYATPTQKLLSGVLRQGAAGVDLFFVLSGFLITGILFDSVGEDGYFRKFFARRALRIFPLYYAVLVVFAVVAGRAYGRQLVSLAFFLGNTHVVTAPIWDSPRPGPPLEHFWSLAVEEQFYLVWPLVVFVVRSRRGILMVCGVGAVVSLVLRIVLATHQVLYADIHAMTVCRLDALLGGGALAMLLRSREHDRVLRLGPALLGMGAVLVAWVAEVGTPVSARWELAVVVSVGYAAYALAGVGVLGCALRKGSAFARLCSAKWLRAVGRYSYGLYVFHFLFAEVVEGPVRRGLEEHGLRGAVAVVLDGLVVAGISAAAAYASFQLWEKRFLRMKRWFAYR